MHDHWIAAVNSSSSALCVPKTLPTIGLGWRKRTTWFFALPEGRGWPDRILRPENGWRRTLMSGQCPSTREGRRGDGHIGQGWVLRFKAIPTTSVRKCADTRKPPCKYLADLRDVFVKKKSELYKPPLRLYTTFQKY
ncbi:hypothetical protein OUZ56_021582 [Daphnia magna]|uniref:Uncharacterized protein n=1 Tax=Daphnia magna TaxID=35525 RepID=A0ABR0AUE7_9CRUS|nr:hypothetical protein OUZ56_021582 [Daphnia magna]